MEQTFFYNTALQFPSWLKKRHRENHHVLALKKLLKIMKLNTVCQSARCPNITECFGKGTATFMILGGQCTRHCLYCGVSKGIPSDPDPSEPKRIREAIEKLELKHVVITSVSRDDLDDGGALQFVQTVREIRKVQYSLIIEVLIPDFQGRSDCLKVIMDNGVNILNHNIETVERLFPIFRPEGNYKRSLQIIELTKTISPHVITKSGLLVGLGETDDEVFQTIQELKKVGCEVLTIGQYLSPSRSHYPVQRFVTPDRFERYKHFSYDQGFLSVASGPYVRSSYQAEDILKF